MLRISGYVCCEAPAEEIKCSRSFVMQLDVWFATRQFGKCYCGNGEVIDVAAE